MFDFLGKRVPGWQQCSMYSNIATIPEERFWKILDSFQYVHFMLISEISCFGREKGTQHNET